MVRFYLIPILTVTDAEGFASRGPEYFAWRNSPPALFPGVRWEGRDYGNEPTMLVAADLTDPDAATLSGKADVVTFADVLDTKLGTNASTMQTAIEALNIPTGNLPASTTYRDVLRRLTAIFLVAQCAQGKGVTIFGPGVTLATQFGALPQAAQDAITTCAPALGYSLAGLTLTTTIRQMYSGIADQAAPTPMLGVTI